MQKFGTTAYNGLLPAQTARLQLGRYLVADKILQMAKQFTVRTS